MNLYIKETFVNATEDYIFGESGETPIETRFQSDEIGLLYSDLQREYGKSKNMYKDTETGTHKVGWVFRKKDEYEDKKEHYIRDVWVEVMVYNDETNTFSNFAFKK